MTASSGFRHEQGLHPVTWVIWTATAATVAMITRNPAYALLLTGIALALYAATSHRHPQARGWSALLRIAAGTALLIVPFNALGVHSGRHVLLRLPETWPIVGGPVTLEAILWGLGGALSLTNLIVLFATLNLSIDQAQILRMTPAFVYEAGLIVSIALTFIPQLMVSAQEIREAQQIRGHRARRVRDMLPLVMALFTTALERSLELAESMEARGFGNVRSNPSRVRDVVNKGLTLVGLAGLLCGFFVWTYIPTARIVGVVAATSGAALLVAAFWAQGKQVLRSRYQRERWTWRDGAVIACCAVVAGAVAAARLRPAGLLGYDPYLSIVPDFRSWLGVALLALLAPLAFQPGGATPERDIP